MSAGLLDRVLPRGASVERETGARVPLLQRPLADYHLLLATTLLLVGLSAIMVFSASALRSYAATGSLFSTGLKQVSFIALGLPVMLLASHAPVRFWRATAYPVLVAAVVLLALVLIPGVGRTVNGAQSWIPLPAGFNLQPAELGKLALVLWGADLLTRKDRLLGEYRHLLVPLVPVLLVVLGLVMLQPDLGTALVLGSIIMALLWVVGTPVRLFAGIATVGVVAATGYALTSSHALARIVSFRDPFADAGDTGFQAVQGFYALSSGGWFGLGLGASREKWTGGLPEVHTDYVFAIIGEELGLIGTFTVLALFMVLILTGVRVAQRAQDPFVRLAASGATAWLGVQAIINMGAVVGLLPITGIPLPLVSFGGSAMLVTLLAVGMLLSFARLEPGAAAALRARPGLLERLPTAAAASAALGPRGASRPLPSAANRSSGNRSSGRRSSSSRTTGTRSAASRASGRPATSVRHRPGRR